jgi:hypothetical protein
MVEIKNLHIGSTFYDYSLLFSVFLFSIFIQHFHSAAVIETTVPNLRRRYVYDGYRHTKSSLPL